MKSERKIKQAYKKGYQEGFNQGVMNALNNFVGITMAVLKNDYNWSDEDLQTFSEKLINRPSQSEPVQEEAEQLSLFEEMPEGKEGIQDEETI